MTRAQAKRLAQEVSRYRGQWVLTKQERVVAHASTVKAAMKSLPAEERKAVHARYVPTSDTSDTTFSAF